MIGTIFALAIAASPADASGIAWVQDDWSRAKAQAIEAGQLVAVDVWATWCHTCLSMKHYVFTDAAMAPVAKKHTWLMLDFDRPDNSTFFAKFPVSAFPTFLVVDPKSEAVVARWVGSGTAAQMAAFYESADVKSKDPLLLGNRALVKEDFKGARKIFEGALKKKDLDSATRTRLLNGWAEAAWKADPKLCAREGAKKIGEVDETAPGIDFIAVVAMCAEQLPEAEKKTVLTAVRDRLLAVSAGPMSALAIDDRSGLYSVLIDAHTGLNAPEEATKLAAVRLAMLEAAATAAETAEKRATFDSHRLEEYLRASRFDDAEKMLLDSEIAQPNDFNHPYRLAVLYKKSGKTNEGLAAIDRALAKGYGGRRIRLYSAKVDLLIQKKNWEWARKTVADAKAEIAKMNPKVVRPSWIKELDGKLAEVAKLEKSAS
jgi:thiol-disulfide isomerase/thioredoxin